MDSKKRMGARGESESNDGVHVAGVKFESGWEILEFTIEEKAGHCTPSFIIGNGQSGCQWGRQCGRRVKAMSKMGGPSGSNADTVENILLQLFCLISQNYYLGTKALRCLFLYLKRSN